MTVQLIALITVTNPGKIAEYRDVAATALAKHEGIVVTALPNPEALEAAITAPTMMAILAFPSVEHARSWHTDPELADIHALRNAAGQSTILMLPDL